MITLPDSGSRNQPLLPLLVGLLDAAQTTVNAIDDNAWDNCIPLDPELATDLAKQCRGIARQLENATGCRP